MTYAGYAGRFLTVDLGTGAIDALPLSDELAEKYLGGRGFVAKLLYDMLPRGIDPLGPENVIVFANGPATGTLIPTASRIAVGVKSPLTGTISASYMGGHFGPELKFAGWDGVIITGVSDHPVTLVIDDRQVRLDDASHLWGKDTLESQRLLQEELGDDFRLGAIGPGGENGVLYATFMHVQHAAGRGGPGAVFGSKKLKAIAVRGSGGISRRPAAGRVHHRLQGASRHHHGEPGAAGVPLGGDDRHAARRQRVRGPALPQPSGRPGSGRRPHPQR